MWWESTEVLVCRQEGVRMKSFSVEVKFREDFFLSSTALVCIGWIIIDNTYFMGTFIKCQKPDHIKTILQKYKHTN